MKKRINSLFLTLVMTLTCVLPFLTACSPNSAADGAYTAAEWLSKVEDGFNLNYYTDDEPVMQNVLRDDPKFSIVQTAVEWGLMDVEDNVDLDAPITKEFCADTLVCAMNFTDPAAVEIKDEDKINPSYLENVKIALENGVFKLESGKFDPVKKLSKEEADEAFDIAHDKWVNFSFTESYDKSVTKENVVNLGGLSEEVSPIVKSDYSVEYSGSRQFFSGDQYVDNTTKTITFKPDKIPEGLKAGSVLSMPADDVVPMDYAVVVDSITENEDGSVTVNTHNAELADVFEEYNVQMHEDVDFSKARIFGPDGTEIKPDRASAEPMSNNYMLLSIQSRPLLNGGGTNFSIGSDDTGKFNIGINVKGDTLTYNIGYEAEEGGVKTSMNFSESITQSIDHKLDVGFLLNVKHAYIKTTTKSVKDFTCSVGIEGEKGWYGTNFPRLHEEQEADGIDNLKDLSNFFQDMSKLENSLKRAGNATGKDSSRKIGNIVLGNGFCFTIRLKVTLEGTAHLSLESSTTYGFEYRNKKCQPISEHKSEKSAELTAKLEITIFAGVSWNALGCCVADVGASIGIGAKAQTAIYHKSVIEGQYDAVCALPMSIAGGGSGGDVRGIDDGVTIPDSYSTCHDFSLYPILRLELCTGSSLIGKIIGGLSVEILGEDNPFLKVHMEDREVVHECSRGLQDTYNIGVGDDLELNIWEDNKLVIPVGGKERGLRIKTLPKGLGVADVSISVADPNVLSAECLFDGSPATGLVSPIKDVNIKVTVTAHPNSSSTLNQELYFKAASAKDTDHFSLTGLSDGVTKLTVKAGTFSKTIDVVVGNGGIKEASISRFMLSDTLVNLTGNGSHKLSVTTAPEGYTMADFSFSSDNPEIASVDSTGVITAQNVTGSTIVYVSSNDGKYTSACMVLVTEGASSGSNAAAAGAGGAGAFGGGSGGGVRDGGSGGVRDGGSGGGVAGGGSGGGGGGAW